MAVRRERVVLELEDQFTGPLGRAAAATKAFESTLDDLDGTVVRTDRDTRRLGDRSGPIEGLSKSAARGSAEIDRYSGRLRLLADTAAILGPALVPIGAVAIPAVTGLAAQFGAAAIATGTAMIAFQGVGEALEAVNKAALEPSVANLEAAQIAMENLAPEARRFVTQLQEMRPAFDGLRDAAASGLFPGLSRALAEAEGAFGRVEDILFAVGDAAGDVAAEFASGIAGPRGQEFLRFVAAEVPGALEELGRTVGNFASGMGELWMAFTPLNRDFSGWLLDASRAFDDWADGLARTQGFQDFVAYVRENGPRVADAMASIGNAVLQIVEAAAPLGGPVLSGLAAFADLIATIANSGAGPAIMSTVTALALLNRGLQAFEAIKTSTLFANLGAGADDAARKMTTMQRATVGLAGALAGLAVVDAAQGGLEDYTVGIEEMTSAVLDFDAMSGLLPEKLAGIEGAIDRLANPGRVEALQDAISGALGGIGNEEEYDRAVAQVESLDSALAGLVRTGEAGRAKSFLGDLGLSQSQMRDLLGLLPQYRDSLAGVRNEAKLAGDAGKDAGDKSASGFRKASSAAENFRRAVERANRVLEGRASMRDYEAAIDDLSKSVRDNGRSLDVNTRKGRANQEALDNIARTTLDVAENMRGTNRVEFLRQARKDFVDAAGKLGIGENRARDLWERLTQVDRTNVKPNIDADASGALGIIDLVEQQMRYLDGLTATTYVQTVRRGRVPGGVQEYADGGTVLGQRYPYGDRELVLAAPGEEVISNRFGQADRHRELLKAINANRYADGGTVGAAPAVQRVHVDVSAQVGGSVNTPFGPASLATIGDVRAEIRRYDEWRNDDRRAGGSG